MSTPPGINPVLPLGNLVRLVPFQIHELPAHLELNDSHVNPEERPQLHAFLEAILSEGNIFAECFHVPIAWKHVSTKAAKPSTAKVDTLIRNITPQDLNDIAWEGRESYNGIPRKKPEGTEKGEFWAMRRSYHEDKKALGTATFKEFEFGLRDDHSKHEEEFTPTLYDARKILDWNEQIAQLTKQLSMYKNVTMSIQEMCHAIPPPMKPRTFAVLVVTADVLATREMELNPSLKLHEKPDFTDGFIAITVPVDLTNQSAAFYTSSRNTKEGTTRQQRTKPVLGVYAAVERVAKVIPYDGRKARSENDTYADRIDKMGQIEWIMATASDAKGVLPMWVQKQAMPGTIAKDVSFFMDWIRKINPITQEDKDAEREAEEARLRPPSMNTLDRRSLERKEEREAKEQTEKEEAMLRSDGSP